MGLVDDLYHQRITFSMSKKFVNYNLLRTFAECISFSMEYGRKRAGLPFKSPNDGYKSFDGSGENARQDIFISMQKYPQLRIQVAVSISRLLKSYKRVSHSSPGTVLQSNQVYVRTFVNR